MYTIKYPSDVHSRAHCSNEMSAKNKFQRKPVPRLVDFYVLVLVLCRLIFVEGIVRLAVRTSALKIEFIMGK